jgi:hypothetical protein
MSAVNNHFSLNGSPSKLKSLSVCMDISTWRSCATLLMLLCLPTASLRSEEHVPATGIKLNGSTVSVPFEANQGATYRLKRKLDLADPAWQNIPGASDLNAASNGPAQLVDPGPLNPGNSFYRISLMNCDAALASNSTNALFYAAAMDLCQQTTEAGTSPGLISATLTLASGAGSPALVSHSIRTSFGGNNVPRSGASMVVLSTGAAAASGQSNPSYNAFQPGLDTGTSSSAPADWLAANGGAFPVAPGCPAAASTTAFNPVMLTLRVRVPSYAHSFRVSAKFFAADFPEYVCSSYNDVFVALLDSTYSGTPANPADKNLAVYVAPSTSRYPVGVNLASGNTGLFNDCVNGNTGCSDGVPGTISVCTGTTGLVGTGFDLAAPGSCNGNSLVGGATSWLQIRGNVVPGEVITLRFAVWDTGDATSDSVVLLDNFAWSPDTTTPGTTVE